HHGIPRAARPAGGEVGARGARDLVRGPLQVLPGVRPLDGLAPLDVEEFLARPRHMFVHRVEAELEGDRGVERHLEDLVLRGNAVKRRTREENAPLETLEERGATTRLVKPAEEREIELSARG